MTLFSLASPTVFVYMQISRCVRSKQAQQAEPKRKNESFEREIDKNEARGENINKQMSEVKKWETRTLLVVRSMYRSDDALANRHSFVACLYILYNEVIFSLLLLLRLFSSAASPAVPLAPRHSGLYSVLSLALAAHFRYAINRLLSALCVALDCARATCSLTACTHRVISFDSLLLFPFSLLLIALCVSRLGVSSRRPLRPV